MSCKPRGQLMRTLALLRQGSKSTLELIAENINSPASRVMDLRRLGYTIKTIVESELDKDTGKRITYAQYFLVGEPDNTPARLDQRIQEEVPDPPLHLVRVPKMRSRPPSKRFVFLQDQRG